MSVFRDALRPLAAGFVREYNVLHLAADLEDDDRNFKRAIHQILYWARRRHGGSFPPEAMDGQTFESLNAGRNSSAIRLTLPEVDAWAIRQEDPDKNVPGRLWAIEAVVWRSSLGAKVAARLMCSSAEVGFVPPVATPGFVRQLTDAVGIFSNGFRLSEQPRRVLVQDDFEDFLDLINDPKRRLPVIAFSLNKSVTSNLENMASTLAGMICGLAFVFILSEDASWELTKRIGKRLSVFDGAVRVYMPGFDETDDPYAHPLQLSQNLHPENLCTQIAQFSIQSVRLGRDILPFSQLRSDYLKARQSQAQSSGANSDVQLQIALRRIDSLEKEVKEAKDLEVYALDEATRVGHEKEEAKEAERKARVYAQYLLQLLSDRGELPDTNIAPPETWSDFADWCESHFIGRVVLTGSARRGCRKANFSDVRLAAKCIVWLATECRKRFMEGGGSVRDEQIENGIRNTACGGDEYFFQWQDRKLCASWHVKNGGNTRDPRLCLRIYYAWDEETQQIIISDMPSHITTDAT